MKKKPISRSENMARIKSKDTRPEIFVRKLLYHNGYRYRINYEALEGKPDIYLSKYAVVIFVNGCFWHLHEGCKKTVLPKTNTAFWKEKLERNKERDTKTYQSLIKQGYKVVVVWECTVNKYMKKKAETGELLKLLTECIKADTSFLEI